MKTKLITFGMLTALIVGAGFLVDQIKNSDRVSVSALSDIRTGQVAIGNKIFVVEFATTSTEKATGLSNRDSLPKGQGMLFVFKPADQPLFWMKEMRFSLDLIWIYDNKVVKISPNLPAPAPGTETADLPTYSAETPIDYVLEVNAGETAGLTVGDEVRVTDSLEV